MRLLLYVTTHLSLLHLKFLTLCWPQMLQRFKIKPEIAFFITPRNNHTNLSHDSIVIKTMYPNATIILSTTIGKQEGAISAVTNPIAIQLFSQFDWIIRLNPDVIMYNIPYIMRFLTHRRDAVLSNCWQNENDIRIMTDFTIFRPRAINIYMTELRFLQCLRSDERLTPYTEPVPPNAENDFTRLISTTLKNRKYIWLWNADNSSRRVQLPGIVYHEHTVSRCLAKSN